MAKKKILLTCPWMPKALMALKRDYSILFPEKFPPDQKELIARAETADAFCPVFTDRVDKTLIEALPSSVKIIASLGVGVDHIDLGAARAKGVAVSNTPDVLSDDTADLTMGLIIAAMRGFYKGELKVRDGTWRGATISSLLGRKVTGKTLGILGLGRIGEKVARRAKAFDMKILYHSKTQKPVLENELGVIFCPDLEDFLRRSDVVSLHCDLSDQTHHIINQDSLKTFKKGAFLINTGRGKLIDEAALVEALKSGHLGGAGLDVYEAEPALAKGLAGFENVTLLPHLGSATFETRTAMGLRVKENLDQFFKTGVAKDPVV